MTTLNLEFLFLSVASKTKFSTHLKHLQHFTPQALRRKEEASLIHTLTASHSQSLTHIHLLFLFSVQESGNGIP